MKTTTVLALLISVSAWAQTSGTAATTATGSTTNTTLAVTGSDKSMHGNDKLLEMCQSMKVKGNCEDIVKQCQAKKGQSPEDCLKQHKK